MNLKNRIDFKLLFDVTNSNPNGNPIDNRPNHFVADNIGYVTQVALKHKVRMEAAREGAQILLTNHPDKNGMTAIRNKLKNSIPVINKDTDYIDAICDEYFDVRAFGALIPKKKEEKQGETIGIVGPVTFNRACSVDPVELVYESITKSYNMRDEDGIESSRYNLESQFVRYGLYVLNGSINASLSEKTHFSYEDAILLKNILIHMFEDDVSNTRPAGSISFRKLYWWEHPSKYGIYKPIDVFDTVTIIKKEEVNFPTKFSDYYISYAEMDKLNLEIL